MSGRAGTGVKPPRIWGLRKTVSPSSRPPVDRRHRRDACPPCGQVATAALVHSGTTSPQRSPQLHAKLSLVLLPKTDVCVDQEQRQDDRELGPVPHERRGPAAISIIQGIGPQKQDRNLRSAWPRFSSTAFGPYCSRRRAASAFERPSPPAERSSRLAWRESPVSPSHPPSSLPRSSSNPAPRSRESPPISGITLLQRIRAARNPETQRRPILSTLSCPRHASTSSRAGSA